MNSGAQIGIDKMLADVKKVLIAGMGGGGDVVTALHVKWALEKIVSSIEWVHGGITAADISHFDEVDVIDDVSAWVTEKSRSKPPHRLIEALIAKKMGTKVFLLSCNNGVKKMIESLNKLIETENIEMIIFIDGGTDSLAFLESSLFSPTEDTMALAALGLGKFSEKLKYRVAGVSIVGSDGEMTLEEIGNQLLKISMAKGYVGGTFFPVERFSEYSELISEVLQRYPTGTALAPLLVTSTEFKMQEDYPFRPIANGFQLATFLFDAQIAAEEGNDFTRLIFEAESRELAEKTIFTALEEHRKMKKNI